MNADPIARWYRWLEYGAFGRLLEKCRFAYLDQLGHAGRVLLLGEGDGRFLRRLLAQNQRATLEVVDSSAAMLALARRGVALSDAARVRFHQSDARHVEFGRYDAVITHFFLDCFSEADAEFLIRQIAFALAPGGVWIVSEFHARSGAAGLAGRFGIRFMYLFFRVFTGLQTTRIPDYQAQMRKHGLQLREEKSWARGLVRAQFWRKP